MSTTTPEPKAVKEKPAKQPKAPKATKSPKPAKEVVVLEKGTATLSELIFDSRFQMRHDKVDASEYAESLVECKGQWIFPPLKVCVVKGNKYVVEGFTRGAAAHIYLEQLAKANKETGTAKPVAEQADYVVPIEYRQATMRQALIEALGANSDHGFRRTNADKRKAVATALAEMPSSSAEKIAEMCKVSPPFVYKLRARLATPEKAEVTDEDVAKAEKDHKANVQADAAEEARKAAQPKPAQPAPKAGPVTTGRVVTEREKRMGLCPNCGSPYWDEHNDGDLCAECLHPYGETVGGSGDDDEELPSGEKVSPAPASPAQKTGSMVNVRLEQLNKLSASFGSFVRELETAGLYKQLKDKLDGIQAVLIQEKTQCRKTK